MNKKQCNNDGGRLQTPLASGFDETTTASEVLGKTDLSGKIAIVTGGTTGIGLETTRVLANAGAHIIIPARDLHKARRNLAGIKNVELEEVDLADPASVDAFTERFLRSGRPLHLLINNAGIMWVPFRKTVRGIESQLAVNYLSQFQLVARLWPALVKSRGARVISVSSQGHQFANFNFDDPNFTVRPYETLQGYGQSKTACNLFAMELDSRGQSANVRSYSLHPGSVGGTDLAREASPDLFRQMGFTDAKGNLLPEVAASLKTIAQGAATTVWCATSPLLQELGGVYCEDCDIAPLECTDAVGVNGVKPYALDKESACRLWTLSEEWTGIHFSI